MVNLGQTVWYMAEGRVHSAPVLSIMRVENLHEDWAHTTAQKDLFTPFGASGTVYATTHGTFSNVFESKEDLLDSL